MNMVEKVAEAIRAASPDVFDYTGKGTVEVIARAAIAAMREPTREMIAKSVQAIDDATDETQDSHEKWIITTGWDYAVPGWQAMIDEALSEPPVDSN